MKYTTISHLGQGGFGKVEKVSNEYGVQLAKKTFTFDESHSFYKSAIKRFEREVMFQQQIGHKNIVPVVDHDLSITPPWLVMPLAEATLESDMANRIVTSVNFIDVIFDIMNGLETIHNLGIFHRDLKPSNILRFKDINDERDYYALSDFGLMSIRETSTTTVTETSLGKQRDYYTPPETAKILKSASPQSDIYSLGCIIHDFIGTQDREICAEINEDGLYGGILLYCTRKDPNKRFPDILTLKESLAEIDHGRVTINSSKGKVLSNLLDSKKELNEQEIIEISDFLDRQNSDSDAILFKLNRVHIEKILEYPTQAKSIARHYAEYLSTAVFGFNICDIVAGRMLMFIEKLPIDIKVLGILAFLKLGTSHNRFYVEELFVKHLGPGADANLVKRMAIEIKVNRSDMSRMINQLMRSLGIISTAFHSDIAILIDNN